MLIQHEEHFMLFALFLNRQFYMRSIIFVSQQLKKQKTTS
jgi:hypothetical protein